MKLNRSAFAFVAAALAGSSLHAAVVTVPLTSAATIRSDNATTNYGADTTLIIGKTTAPATLHGLLSTSLSSIPAGATINSISLTLTMNGTGATTNLAGAVNLELYQLTGTYTEGTGSSSGAANSTVNWNNRNSTTAWTTAGGDYTTLLSTAADDPSTGTADGSDILVFNTSSSFVAAAQLALSSGTDLSTLIKLNAINEAQNSRRAFFYYSDDTTTAAYRPYLTIDYTIPEPSAMILGAGGLGLTLLRRRRGV